MFQALQHDYLSKVAATFGIDLRRLLLDNLAVIGNLDEPLKGKRLRLCGVQSGEEF